MLLEEILRIQELMGKNLITEQTIWSALTKIVRDFADNTASLSSKYADDFTRLATAKTDEEAISILAKLANAEKQFSDIILPEVMSSLSDEVRTELGQIIKMAEDQLAGGTPRAVVDDLVEKRLKAINSPFEGVRDILRKRVKDSLDSVGTTPKPPNPNDPVPPPNPNDTGIITSLKNTFKEWDTIVPGGLSVKDKLLLGQHFAWRSLRVKLNYVLNNLLNTTLAGKQASLNKIASLIKKQQQLGLNAEESVLIYRTIDAELEALRKNENFVKEKLYDTLKDELDKVLGAGRGYEFVQKLKANDAMSPDAPTYWKYLMDETYLGKIFTAPRGKDGKIIWNQWVRNFLERTAMTLTTGNPRKIGEIFDEFIKVYGVAWGTAAWAAWMKVISLTIWPAFLGFVDMAYYGFKNAGGVEDFGGWWNLYKDMVWERFKDSFYDDYVEKYNEELKKNVGERKFNLFKAVNPFTFFWDDISRGLDWHVAGGTRKFLDDMNRRGQESLRNAGVPIDGNQVSQLISYKNNLQSFQDFGEAAGYTLEELEKFTYDESTMQGTTSDGRVFQLKEEENPTTGTKFKNFVQITGPGIQ